MSSPNQRMGRRRKKTQKRRILFFTLFLPLLLVVFTGAGYGAFLYKKAETIVSDSYMTDGREKSALRDADVHPLEDNISILFMGIDDNNKRKYGDNSRTDALVLATLNVKDKTIKMLSIPRDTYAYIPEEDDYNKINHAHVVGGPTATIETVEELLDVPVDYYVRLNFYAFVDVVNALDGIKFNVPYDIREKDSSDVHYTYVKEGLQTLNGEEALAVARTRHADSDIERGKRQQQILQAIAKKATSFNSITKYDELLEAVGSNMRTNLTFSEMKSLITYAETDKGLNYESLALKGTDDFLPSGAYIYRPDETELEVIKGKLQRHLDIEPSDDSDEDSESEDESYSTE
ncbi:LCP family protein [Domibacillus sp. DTU_2020_1001157_1_SI_ALB_TIR_016]|uniref:LCP family protein n=1 Tax=Domibacillus sp. DTU_2020_1001157_1_SI_ALB_TIR_016 TaxID=3077789 RepID=UPI0028EB333C|nr:LCP family protein [Domibacillus sp. DTU_2020_1001157_1_SI_ALB_TIR_016]WNS81274.1 LCP family protein [Domibacillus sp. DTU_2020_1001157_1_SI_ALB_TIR_016]